MTSFNILVLLALVLFLSCSNEDTKYYHGVAYHHIEEEGRPLSLEEFSPLCMPVPDVIVWAYYEEWVSELSDYRRVTLGPDRSDHHGHFQLPEADSYPPVRHGANIRDTHFDHYYFLGNSLNSIRQVALFNRIPIIFEFDSNDQNQAIDFDELIYFVKHPKINFNNNTITSYKWDNVFGTKSIRTEVAENMNLQLKFRFKYEPEEALRTFDFYSGDEARKIFKVEFDK